MARKGAGFVRLFLMLLFELLGNRSIYLISLIGTLEAFTTDGFSKTASVSRAFSYMALRERSRNTKIANLNLAVSIDQNISRLQVSVHHVA